MDNFSNIETQDNKGGVFIKRFLKFSCYLRFVIYLHILLSLPVLAKNDLQIGVYKVGASTTLATFFKESVRMNGLLNVKNEFSASSLVLVAEKFSIHVYGITGSDSGFAALATVKSKEMDQTFIVNGSFIFSGESEKNKYVSIRLRSDEAQILAIAQQRQQETLDLVDRVLRTLQ